MDPGQGPSRVGRYEIRREIGRGMMGVVYEAWDPALGRKIALKTVKAVAPSRSEREAWEQRFLSEARAAARLSHPCIVVVHDVGRDAESDTLYMALEYLHGETLAEKISGRRPLPWREALRIVGRVADALHHAHSQGVVHRDVKPANIMILTSGEPKILDFGIARIDAGALTLPGDLFGTPLYMSPEQATGDVVDARSDLFSLGAIAWALLTGRTAFEASNVAAILTRVMHRDPQAPSELVAGIPDDVDRVLARAMAKSPEDRYPDGHALAEDIEDVLAGRTPRHLIDWVAPRTGERTIASDRLRADTVTAELPDESPPAGTPDAPPPAAAGPRRRRARALLLLVLLGACAAGYLYQRPENLAVWTDFARRASASGWGPETRRLLDSVRTAWTERVTTGAAESVREVAPRAPLAEPARGQAASTEASPAASEPQTEDAAAGGGAPLLDGSVPATSLAAEAGVEGTGEPPASAGPAAPAGTESPTTTTTTLSAAPALPPGPAARATASPPDAPSAPPGVRDRIEPRAFLSVGFGHRLKSGTLEVWVDERRVARENLDSRVRAKLLLLEVREGSVQQTLPLAPGRHTIRVRVRSGGQTRSAQTAARFLKGTTRRLEIGISRLSGKLSLEWK